MSAFSRIADPTDLEAVRAAIADAERPEDLVPLGLRTLVIAPDVASLAPAHVRALLPEGAGRASVALLVDATRILSGETDLKETVHRALEEEFVVVPTVLGEPGHLHVDDAALDGATAAVTGADAVVAVGSGTISDIAKVASARAGGIPLVIVQTAASVDGFTDNVSVVLRSGAKRTIDSRWPDVVLADTTVIATAPVELNASGFGELQSLFTAPADWWLAAQVGTDTTFHTTPRDLLLEFAGDPAEWGAGLGEGRARPVEQLTRVLAIRGIGTGIAGSTACLSGVEHLVSHMLDMNAVARGADVGLHGAQVGVASVVAAAAWDHLFAQARAGRAVVPPVGDEEATVRAAFAVCDPSGALGAECWRDYSAKRAAWAAAPADPLDLLADPAALEQRLGAMRPDREAIARALAVAGAPLRREDLGAHVTPEIWRWAVANCLYMRNRVTVIDLLAAAGWWTAADVDAVLALADDAVRAAVAAEVTA
ncbi:iron-containing alcohol dehydrogenase [Microbacterium enclense]|uniref:Iron-containing alcohol dehydrogenase n=1 Tax=Microbacterium enclense TaxID=993073 RepID=A0A3S3LI85_9MICO|nr:iron-containing alcohol dehydrogenase [Microbacterium enclense]RWR22371.1 iron-containing alcohol dehydrogenase [Microbacterium enclense]